MAIRDGLKAQILRYHFAEHLREGTIARQLGVHHSTVERVLSEAGVQRERRRPRRPSMLDPYANAQPAATIHALTSWPPIRHTATMRP